MRKTFVGFVAALVAALVLCGCGRHKASSKADASQLERAFALTTGASPADDRSPAALATTAVAAIRSQDWPRAVFILNQLRTTKGLTAEQAEAVHNAHGNANVKLVELAAKGNPDAKAMIDTLQKEQGRR